jgi:hypothetical protein
MDENVLKEMLRLDPFLIGRLIKEASIGPKEMMRLAVNWIDEAKDRFWCPGCEKAQSHPEIVAPWISPDGRLVCFYLVCRRCAKSGVDTFRAGDRPYSQRRADLMERALVARYPHIAANLPADYFGDSFEEPDAPQHLHGAYLMVPNPMQPTIDGQARQIAYRRFLVIRFLSSILDTLDLDAQAALVWHLGERYPLVAVCRNGEEPEGLEAWFKVKGWTEEQARDLMAYACTLGADPETFNPLCMVHLPGAVNPVTGKKQKILYLDPEIRG